MIRIENTQVFGWEAAIRGMRNPKNSWDKSDSRYGCSPGHRYPGCGKNCRSECDFIVGPNDLALMKTLSKAGDDHGKFMRMIHVQVDIAAPLYWWKEADQYKVSTVTGSCSTMHKIADKEFALEDFSCEHLDDDCVTVEVNGGDHFYPLTALGILGVTINGLNYWRRRYLDTQNKNDWWQMIQLLPSSYNQRRTWDLNYAVLKHIYHARQGHKLDEWRTVCDWIETLPYAKELIIGE